MQIQYFGRFFDVREDEKISYTIQVQDLADVSTVNSSVTTSFKLPKTLSNLEAMKYLSIPSDTSNIPYIKNDVKLYDQGTILINNGWLKVISTDSENFNVNIENGIVDFFKTIENKTIGKDLDLSDVNHSKDLVTVVDSFERDDYTYIVADYNGMNTYKVSGVEYINSDYLVPSLNNKYIWDKIFEFAGYTYSGSVFELDEFTNLWMTYPKAPPTDISDEDYPEPVRRFETSSSNPIFNYNWNVDDGVVNFTLENIFTDEVTFLNNEITIEKSGTYHLRSFDFDGYASFMRLNQWEEPTGQWYRVKLQLGYFLNGVEFRTGEIGNLGLQEIQLMLRAGDTLRLFLYFDPFIIGTSIPYSNHTVGQLQDVSLDYYNFRLFQVSQTIVDFGNELLDFSIVDYFKEILIRFALTPFIDNETRHINFLTLDERLQGSKVIDWTDKYIERENESYTYSSYAIKNWFRHKYNDENATFNDGALNVNNVNLELEKTIWSSKIYSYNKEITSWYSDELQNNSFPIWNREVKEIIDNDTNTREFEVKYKGLENRYYFIRRKFSTNTLNIGSQLLRSETTSSLTAIADTRNLSYIEMTTNYYSNFSRIMSDTRIHDINVYLDVNDLLELDLEALYYFSQENQYYILNRITVDLETRIGKGEFLRVKYR